MRCAFNSFNHWADNCHVRLRSAPVIVAAAVAAALSAPGLVRHDPDPARKLAGEWTMRFPGGATGTIRFGVV